MERCLPNEDGGHTRRMRGIDIATIGHAARGRAKCATVDADCRNLRSRSVTEQPILLADARKRPTCVCSFQPLLRNEGAER